MFEKLTFYVKTLKRIVNNKAYAINRADLDENLVKSVEEVQHILSALNELTLNVGVGVRIVDVKFAKLKPNAIIPSYAKPGDAGLDLTAIDFKYVKEDKVDFYEYDFGLAVEIPEGYVGLIFPRSSITKTDLILSNCVGVVDSGYRGNLTARFRKMSGSPHTYKTGERVAQLIVMPYPKTNIKEVEYNELTKTTRGSGGFGSSGS